MGKYKVIEIASKEDLDAVLFNEEIPSEVKLGILQQIMEIEKEAKLDDSSEEDEKTCDCCCNGNKENDLKNKHRIAKLALADLFKELRKELELDFNNKDVFKAMGL